MRDNETVTVKSDDCFTNDNQPQDNSRNISNSNKTKANQEEKRMFPSTDKPEFFFKWVLRKFRVEIKKKFDDKNSGRRNRYKTNNIV